MQPDALVLAYLAGRVVMVYVGDARLAAGLQGG